MRKSWIIAQNRSGYITQKLLNKKTEFIFHSTLRMVKAFLSNKPEAFFERNYLHDNIDSALLMHGFMSKRFYLTLECNVHYDIVIEYAFANFQLEAEVKKKLEAAGALAREITLKPDFETFYQNVLNYQNKKHIYSL